MPSFQTTLTPSKRASGRFVYGVRRALQKALAEEQKNGVSQSSIARALGVHRSVISRELRGTKDITLSRVGELAWALGRRAILDLPERAAAPAGSNAPPIVTPSRITPQPKPTGETLTLSLGGGIRSRAA